MYLDYLYAVSHLHMQFDMEIFSKHFLNSHALERSNFDEWNHQNPEKTLENTLRHKPYNLNISFDFCNLLQTFSLLAVLLQCPIDIVAKLIFYTHYSKLCIVGF